MIRRLYIIIYICCCFISVHAQSSEERYRAIYDQAEQDYNIGRLEHAEQELSNNLRNFMLSGYGSQRRC